MKSVGWLLALSIIISMLSCSGSGNEEAGDSSSKQTEQVQTAAQDPPPATNGVLIHQRWQLDIPMDQLDLLPEGQRDSSIGYIGNAEDFAALWQIINPMDPPPAIDFQTQMPLFVRNTQYYNRINIAKVTLKDGEAEIIAMETLSARPIEERAAMVLFVVPRKGIERLKSGKTVVELK